MDDLQWEYLSGDGDFRSPEVTALRDEADIIVTNPPFSLFREFMGWIVNGKKNFSIVGNQNAISYKEIFPLIADNKLWKGATANSTDMVFGVPKGAHVSDSDRAKAEKLGYQSDDSYDYTRLGNSCWFTNIEHGRRHEPMKLMSRADNLKFSKPLNNKGGYRQYDNYDALDVPLSIAIPSDFDGVMGVPISYLDRHNPDEFEIVGIAKAPLGTPSKTYPKQTQIGKNGQRSQVTKLNDGPVIRVDKPPADDTYYEVDGNLYIQLFARILIRRRSAS
ncbi:adenine-specific methyltransferase EcoRI family protein [Tsukamurella spumae]|uniref:adenine-specific methyltransferase EcoRI family protein n=1 Tax=Tsukamurella spumae TaxID=44753 RepID=UPI0028B04EC7|nr:adenine-specific methyltransferase EcoRI family protein [Tsukamurella spumae]